LSYYKHLEYELNQRNKPVATIKVPPLHYFIPSVSFSLVFIYIISLKNCDFMQVCRYVYNVQCISLWDKAIVFLGNTNAYISGAPEFTPGFSGFSCYSIFSFMCMFCRSMFVLLYFLFGHCVVCSSSNYGFWLPLWYLQTLLPTVILSDKSHAHFNVHIATHLSVKLPTFYLYPY
jgi:hypothetical protein